MEYASTCWDPYKVDVNCLDMVQRRAACYACNSYTEQTPGCVTAMVSSLGWETLLTMLFKIKHNLVEIPEAESIIRSNAVEHQGHRGFSSPTPMSQCIRCRPRTIQDWNKPQEFEVRSLIHPYSLKTKAHYVIT